MTWLKGYNVFEKNVTYVSYARSGVEYYTNNLSEIYELYNEGWSFNSYYDGFRAIPPEECIVDITNYQKAAQYKNLEFNLIYYDFLNDLILKNKLHYFIDSIIQEKNIFYKNFKYLVSYGPILETEIRISGSDNRIRNLKFDMVDKFLNSKDYKYYLSKVENQITLDNNKEEAIIKIMDRSKREQEFFLDVIEKTKIIKNVNVYNEKVFSIDNIKIIDWDNIDVILFIPWGCFKYLSSFVTSEIIDKIMFYEVHIEQTKGTSFELFGKDLEGKNVLIIDNMYSGKTIEKVRKIVKNKGGNPIVLGLNPKNKNNIIMSDYVMILNKILMSQELDMQSKTFFRDMYISILKS